VGLKVAAGLAATPKKQMVVEHMGKSGDLWENIMKTSCFCSNP
jgi:hypothetical protein